MREVLPIANRAKGHGDRENVRIHCQHHTSHRHASDCLLTQGKALDSVAPQKNLRMELYWDVISSDASLDEGWFVKKKGRLPLQS